MKLTNIQEVEGFLETVQKCKGDVFLRSPMDDIYNLKSTLSQYVAMGALLGEHGDELELFCEDRDDESLFFAYFSKHPDVIG
jgi:hypothetical protein